jgi:hypothetical protein
MNQLTHDFSPEVYLLAGKLVPIVSTNHLVVHELIGVHKPSPTQGRRKNLHKRGYSTTRAIH